MPFSPEMRASDEDRDRAAASLREHCAQGRLTVDELDERLTAVFAARTHGDLRQVTADLPEEDLHQRPIPAWQHARPAQQAHHDLHRPGMRANWAAYASVNLVCFTIWLLTVVGSGSWVYPWWIWVAGPWGALTLAGQIFGPHRDDRR
jgi:Domain of unknown function (DUF1707)